MTGSHDLEIRILGFSKRKSSLHALFRFHPTVPETDASGAVEADIRGDDGENQVGDPVADGNRAAEGNDDELVGCVCGDETGNIGCDGAEWRWRLDWDSGYSTCAWKGGWGGIGWQDSLLKLGERVCLRGLDPGAVSLRAKNLGVGAVVVVEAVCSSAILGEELQLIEDSGRDSYNHGLLAERYMNFRVTINIPLLSRATGPALTTPTNPKTAAPRYFDIGAIFS